MSAAVPLTPDTPALATVLRAVARGWRPFPLDHPSHPDCISRKCTREREQWTGPGEPDCPRGHHEKRGKHPYGHWPTQTASPQPPGMLRAWFANQPMNIGIACKPSGLVVLDEDECDALGIFAAELGETLPRTYRVRTARGWHWYFSVPDGATIGNRTGTLKARHIDVRGGKGDGGYVVGAGSVHWTGHVYTAEDESAPLAALPAWVIAQISAESADTATGREFNPDDVRSGTAEELEATYRYHLSQVTVPGFQSSFFTAARDGWRLFNLGLLPQEHMFADWDAAIRQWWHASANAGDMKLIDQARIKALESPWELRDPVLELEVVAPAAEGGSPSGELAAGAPEGSPPPAAAQGESYDPAEVARLAAEKRERDEYAAELAKERRRRAVRAELDSEHAAELVELDFDAFLAAPRPDYLVPRMFYRDGLSVVFGPPGAAKSFLVLDVALSLACGREWRGRRLDRAVVHYVMAEGQATNTMRTLAWLAHHGVDASEGRGWFKAYPQAIVLTEAGVRQYIERVRADRPAMIILDTKNLMFAGKESSGDDYGTMLRVLHSLREAAGGCAIVLIDHSGLGDESRTRGSNAQKGGVDTEIMVSDSGNGVRVAKVTRDKSGQIGTTWEYRLHQVDSVPRPPDVDPPAVCVPAEAGTAESGSAAFGEHWWDMSRGQLPEGVAMMGGMDGLAAGDVFRALLHTRDVDGMTVSQIRTLLDEGPRKHSRASIYRAVSRLAEAGFLHQPAAKNYALTSEWAQWQGRAPLEL